VTAASLIGFGLALAVTTLVASGLLLGLFAGVHAWLGRRGDAAVQHAGTWALVGPVVLGLLVAGALIVRSLLVVGAGGPDHCQEHPQHLHLCVAHGLWSSSPLAVGLLAGYGVAVVVRLGLLGWRRARARVAIATLRLVAAERERGLALVPSGRVFVFVADRVVYASTAAWDVLSVEERQAVLAHEQAHVERRDARRLLLLEIAAAFTIPWLAPRAIAAWRAAGEHLCDRAASDRLGDPVPVASALVTLARRATPSPGLAFIDGSRSSVVARVEAVLAPAPRARSQVRFFAFAAAGIAALVIILLDPLHHALETLLGLVG
jgi:hypothetical protein